VPARVLELGGEINIGGLVRTKNLPAFFRIERANQRKLLDIAKELKGQVSTKFLTQLKRNLEEPATYLI
jgi:hypothetical protein